MNADSLFVAQRAEVGMFSDTDEAIYRKIVQLSQEGICIADAAGRFTFVNPRFAEMLQRPMSELLGRPVRDFLDVDDIDAFEWRQEERRRGRLRSGQVELTLMRADGTALRVLSTTATFYDGDRLTGVLCMITDREEARRQSDMAANLAAINEEVQTFTYSVSHDLRAPVRAIDGFARELQLDAHTALSPRSSHYVERIRAAASRMRHIIDALLDLSSASRRPLQRQRVDLSAIARVILGELEYGPRSVTVDVAPHIQAAGDPHLLRIVLDNLLGNAVKFTANKAETQIAFGCLTENGEVIYFVRDNGAGFDPKRASGLFTPFQRLHPSGEFEGSGIGLATVQRIVQRHGGRIWGEGIPGEGAAFYFTLGRSGVADP
jgi:PAS domain S-box-containing protein